MKKTTKQATNLGFSASKGAGIPFYTSNLKFIAFFVIFFALLTIPTTKILATITAPEVLPYIWQGHIFDEATAYAPFGDAGETYIWYCEDKDLLTLRAGKDLGLVFACGNFANHKNSGQVYCDSEGNCGDLLFNDEYFSISAINPIPSTLCYDSSTLLTSQNLLASSTENWNGQNCLNETTIGDIILTYNILTGGTSPDFEPSFPTECVFSTTSTSTLNNFNATGTVRIPIENLYHWFDFSVVAEDFNTAEKFYFSTSTDLDAGDFLDYSIPISLPDGSWKISYLLQGVYFESSFFSSHWCEHTGIGTGLPLPTWKEITEAEFLGLEDCSSYPLLERLVCDLKNAIKKIFVPSASSITALKNTIDGLKNKAPMNYISITKDFFDDVKNGINNSQNLTFKILNKTGAVSFAFWDNTTSLAGKNQTFTQIFKTFFIFLIIFSFFNLGYFLC